MLKTGVNWYHLNSNFKKNLPVVSEVVIEKKSPICLPRNRIIYGAPGTGKSRKIDEDKDKFFPQDPEYVLRVTFHNSYSYSHFIGSYRPVPLYQDSEKNIYDSDKSTQLEDKKEPLIDYRFEPGPFLEMFCRAKKDSDCDFLLIIEEINRADAASVFGEVFQLLDRDEDGESHYPVTLSKAAMDFLKQRGIDDSEIRIPGNLYLWATMNSADQGVHPLDAAFKRRWTFEYQKLDEFENETQDWEIHLNFLTGENKLFKWNDFRHIINNFLKQQDFIPEDKLIGPFFLKKDELNDGKSFQNKLLLYLRDDVLRHDPKTLFKETTFSDIMSKYNAGEQIFVQKVHDQLVKRPQNE